MQYLIKIILSAIIITLVSEVSKRNNLGGAILASLPLTSVLAMIWLYRDTHDVARISQLSVGIFWLVLPSLILFLALPFLLKRGMSFYASLSIASAATVVGYFVMTQFMRRFGV
jgi:hypothetical protein